jgi:aryl-alcohol dehydrogenase-like predicted oxidoreductase
MIKRQFGKTGIDVSILGFGAGHIGKPDQDEKTVDRLLNETLDLGINFIDTARAYGLSETRIGKYISHRRKEFILSTKVGYDVEWKPDWTYDSVVGGVDQALKLMKTDYIDIVHLHSCPKETLERGDVIQGLEKAKQDGKVRFIAYSGENEALEYAILINRFDSIQCSVNICDQHSITKYLPLAVEKGLGVIAKRPIANAPWRHADPPVGHYSEEYWHRLKKMKPDLPPIDDFADAAIRFTVCTKGVSTAIIGSSDIKHIKEMISSLEKGPLETAVKIQIKEAFRIHDDNWRGLI